MQKGEAGGHKQSIKDDSMYACTVFTIADFSRRSTVSIYSGGLYSAAVDSRTDEVNKIIMHEVFDSSFLSFIFSKLLHLI